MCLQRCTDGQNDIPRHQLSEFFLLRKIDVASKTVDDRTNTCSRYFKIPLPPERIAFNLRRPSARFVTSFFLVLFPPRVYMMRRNSSSIRGDRNRRHDTALPFLALPPCGRRRTVIRRRSTNLELKLNDGINGTERRRAGRETRSASISTARLLS